jgi:hypothetical protein
MKYNNRYRKCMTKDIDTQAFWNSMMEGTTAQVYVELMLAKAKVIRNSQSDNND